MSTRVIIEGMLQENQEYLELWHTNAWFRMAVQTAAAQFIPSLLKGFAVEAEEMNRQQKQAQALMEHANLWPSPPVTPR